MPPTVRHTHDGPLAHRHDDTGPAAYVALPVNESMGWGPEDRARFWQKRNPKNRKGQILHTHSVLR